MLIFSTARSTRPPPLKLSDTTAQGFDVDLRVLECHRIRESICLYVGDVSLTSFKWREQCCAKYRIVMELSSTTDRTIAH
jgi:hypothetical protein